MSTADTVVPFPSAPLAPAPDRAFGLMLGPGLSLLAQVAQPLREAPAPLCIA